MPRLRICARQRRKRLEGQNGEAETRIVEILARAAQDIRSA